MNISRYIGLALLMLYSLLTAYAQQDGASGQKLKNVQQALLTMPEIDRASFLCEIEGLLFMEDGSLPYENGGAIMGYNEEELYYYKDVRRDAKFISPDGTVHTWWQVHDGILRNHAVRAKLIESKRGLAECGQNAVIRPFRHEIRQLKKYFDNHTRILADIKLGRYNPEKYKLGKAQPEVLTVSSTAPAAAPVTKQLSKALNMLKDLKDQKTRNVIVMAVLNEATTDTLHEQAYISPKGEVIYALEELENAGALTTAAKILGTLKEAGDAASAASAVSDRYTKTIASVRHGQELRNLRMENFSRNLDAMRAKIEEDVANNDSPVRGKMAVVEALRALQEIVDPVCRVAVAVSIAEPHTPQDVFESSFIDKNHHCVNGYDIIRRNHAEETLLMLMAAAAQHEEVRDAVKSAYEKELTEQQAEQDKASQRRASRVKSVLSELEAKKAKERLKKAEEASRD